MGKEHLTFGRCKEKERGKLDVGQRGERKERRIYFALEIRIILAKKNGEAIRKKRRRRQLLSRSVTNGGSRAKAGKVEASSSQGEGNKKRKVLRQGEKGGKKRLRKTKRRGECEKTGGTKKESRNNGDCGPCERGRGEEKKITRQVVWQSGVKEGGEVHREDHAGKGQETAV